MARTAIAFLIATTAFAYGVAVGKWEVFPHGPLQTAYHEVRGKVADSGVKGPKVQVSQATSVESALPSQFYDIALRSYGAFETPTALKGALDYVGPDLIASTFHGQLYRFGEPAGGSGEGELVRLASTVPINPEAYLRSGGESAKRSWFDVQDLLVSDEGERVRLFASHHYWHEDAECAVVRVSVAEGSADDILSESVPLTWRTLFESTPCMKLRARSSDVGFGGLGSGGRMLSREGGDLLLTLGDHGNHPVNNGRKYAQNPDVSYGKTLLIDTETGAARTFTAGHRNPQGLTRDGAGRLWLTEHGPRGGDELNLLDEGQNYGWPLVTYGTHYGTLTWPPAARQGSHEGYVKPAFAWSPSPGLSVLTHVTAAAFPLWEGDLLAGSLVGHTLFRIRTDRGRVVMVESIPFGHRIRDLAQSPDGRLVVLTDQGLLVFMEPVEGQEPPVPVAN